MIYAVATLAATTFGRRCAARSVTMSPAAVTTDGRTSRVVATLAASNPLLGRRHVVMIVEMTLIVSNMMTLAVVMLDDVHGTLSRVGQHAMMTPAVTVMHLVVTSAVKTRAVAPKCVAMSRGVNRDGTWRIGMLTNPGEVSVRGRIAPPPPRGQRVGRISGKGWIGLTTGTAGVGDEPLRSPAPVGSRGHVRPRPLPVAVSYTVSHTP
eukprot:Hpha_TRINITY_DN11129_c0_g1::TRINITY_DN11129_c0_g1_i1::g.28209::m.28209